MVGDFRQWERLIIINLLQAIQKQLGLKKIELLVLLYWYMKTAKKLLINIYW